MQGIKEPFWSKLREVGGKAGTFQGKLEEGLAQKRGGGRKFSRQREQPVPRS